MKSLSFLTSFLLLSGSFLFAQSGDTNKGVGFGGPSFVNTALAGEWTMEVGGMGAGFVSDQLYIGGGGFGLSQQNDTYEYDMGYGGVMLGYFWQGSGKTAVNFYVFGGFGTIVETGESIENEDDFWAIRPAAEIDFLLTDWLRLGIGGGYRQIMGTTNTTLEKSDMSAPFGSITFRFGNWGNEF